MKRSALAREIDFKFDADQALDNFGSQVTKCLPDVSALDRRDLVTVLMAYRDVVVPTFVPWMSATWSKCRSPLARKTLRENLLVEIGEEHQDMYYDFIKAINCDRVANQISRNLDQLVSAITDIVPSPIDGLLVISGIEAASARFSPWIASVAKKLDFPDMKYAEVHSLADVTHATEILGALKAEMEFNQAMPTGSPGNPLALRLLTDLFYLVFNSHVSDFRQVSN